MDPLRTPESFSKYSALHFASVFKFSQDHTARICLTSSTPCSAAVSYITLVSWRSSFTVASPLPLLCGFCYLLSILSSVQLEILCCLHILCSQHHVQCCSHSSKYSAPLGSWLEGREQNWRDAEKAPASTAVISTQTHLGRQAKWGMPRSCWLMGPFIGLWASLWNIFCLIIKVGGPSSFQVVPPLGREPWELQ